jgi:hypothetical protein
MRILFFEVLYLTYTPLICPPLRQFSDTAGAERYRQITLSYYSAAAYVHERCSTMRKKI